MSVMAEPPSEAGADHIRAMLAPSTVAARFTGCPGSVDNLTEFEGGEAELVPTILLAVTVNV